MARLTIRLFQRPQSGQRLFHIDLASDEDATPREHEQHHRRLVTSLLPGLDLDGDNGPNVRIDRERLQSDPIIGGCGGDDGYEVIDLG